MAVRIVAGASRGLLRVPAGSLVCTATSVAVSLQHNSVECAPELSNLDNAHRQLPAAISRRQKVAVAAVQRMTIARALALYSKIVKRVLRQWFKAAQLARRVATLATLAAPLCVLFPLSTWSSASAATAAEDEALGNNSNNKQRRRGGFDPALHNPDAAPDKLSALDNDPQATVFEKALWHYLRWSIGQAGPTCIKMAQWASTRDDLFAAELCAKLAELQQEAPPHPWCHTEAVLTESFGADWASKLLISEQDRRTPLGSGCVAQVYRGSVIGGIKAWGGGSGGSEEEAVANAGKASSETLGDQHVAVKVLHPRINEQVTEDLCLMRWAAIFIEQWFPDLATLGPEKVVEDFAERLEQQLDLRKEAQHLVRFRENFDCKGLSVDFPRPLIEGNLSGSPKVLVETFVDKAKPILEFIEDASVTQETKKALSGICLKAIMKMVLLDNMLHGDLHPGNIMVRDLRGSNAESQKVEPAASMFDWLQEKLGLSSASSSTGAGAMAGLEVIFLDAGLSIDLDDYSHKNMVGILRAFTENDGRRAARLAVEASDRSAALEALEKADEERSLFGSLTAGIFGGLGGGSRDKVEEHATHSQGNNGARGGKGKGGSGGGVAGGSSTTTREDSLEKFYEGCHSVMQQAADSDNLTLELGNHMRNMFGLACDNRVRLEPYFVSVALAVRVMEGIASRLDPDVQLRPFATEIFKQMPVERQLEAVGLHTEAKVAVGAKAKAAEAEKLVAEELAEAEKTLVVAAESTKEVVIGTAAGLARKLTRGAAPARSHEIEK